VKMSEVEIDDLLPDFIGSCGKKLTDQRQNI
jgi:hypothetical protein